MTHLLEKKLIEAADLIKNSKHTTAFTGAGISVESGIPPFRGADGLWSKYDPKVLDLQYFYKNPKDAWKVIRELFYDFFGKAKPNPAHYALANFEKNNLLKAVITQNIDNLHQEAGSKTVYEFHGTAQFLVDIKTGDRFRIEEINMKKIPVTNPKTGNLLKPDFIFFGEGIPEYANRKSFEEANNAEILIIIGTTGEVMPASMIPYQAKRNNATIIEINTEKSLYTNQITDIFLQAKAGEVLYKLEQLVLGKNSS